MRLPVPVPVTINTISLPLLQLERLIISCVIVVKSGLSCVAPVELQESGVQSTEAEVLVREEILLEFEPN